MKDIGRKCYHLVGGLGLLSLYFVLKRDQALVLYAVLFFTVLALDLLRLKVAAVNDFVFDKFASFIRRSETNKITGTAPYILGIGLSLLLYRTDIASIAICFLAFGDVAATMIGERFGRTKIGSKSIEGTIAFILAAVSAGSLASFAGASVGYGIILFGAVVAAGVEVLPLPVDDNLLIPLVSGGAMALAASLTAG